MIAESQLEDYDLQPQFKRDLEKDEGNTCTSPTVIAFCQKYYANQSVKSQETEKKIKLKGK